MFNTDYFHTVEYGNIYYNVLIKLAPLVFWIYIIFKYYYPYYKNYAKSPSIILFIVLIPFLTVFTEFILNKDLFLTNKTSVPSLWSYCLTLIDQNKNKNKDVLAIWNYNCARNQVENIRGIASQLQTKFFYLNMSLFLLILIFNNFSKTQHTKMNSTHITFTMIALLMGTIGSTIRSFTTGYYWSMLVLMFMSTIFNMNISAFLIVIYSLFT